MTPADPVTRMLRHVAVAGLPGAEPVPRNLPGTESLALVDAAVATRMTGPLLALVDAGDLDLPTENIDVLADAHRRALLWCLHLERRLLGLLDLFDAAGVDPVLIKGSALAHLDHEGPHLRTFADLDLLIPDHQMDRAVVMLAGEGASRPWAQRRSGYDSRFAKSVTMTMLDGTEVDLHRTICDGVHGVRVPIEEVHAAPDRLVLGGRSVAVPRPLHRMLHSAYHLVLGSAEPALHNLADMARHLHDGRLTPETVTPTARRWRGEAVLATALDAVASTLPMELPPPWRRWREDFRPDRTETAIIAAQRDEGSSFGPGRVRAVAELPDLATATAYLTAVIWPSAEHLRSRGISRFAPLNRSRR